MSRQKCLYAELDELDKDLKNSRSLHNCTRKWIQIVETYLKPPIGVNGLIGIIEEWVIIRKVPIKHEFSLSEKTRTIEEILSLVTARFKRDKHSYFWLPCAADAKNKIATMTATAVLNEIRVPGVPSTNDVISQPTILSMVS